MNPCLNGFSGKDEAEGGVAELSRAEMRLRDSTSQAKSKGEATVEGTQEDAMMMVWWDHARILKMSAIRCYKMLNPLQFISLLVSSVLVLLPFILKDTARRRAESAADEADLQENALGHLAAQWGPGVILSPWILGNKNIN